MIEGTGYFRFLIFDLGFGKLKISLLILCLSLLFAITSIAQDYQDNTKGDTQAEPEGYRENALRRFETILTISIPFTALHSYLAIRGIEMIRQQKVAPKMQKGDWNAIAGLTVLFSGFIAFRDWLHTRREDVSEKKTPRGTTGLPASMLDTENFMMYPGLVSICTKF